MSRSNNRSNSSPLMRIKVEDEDDGIDSDDHSNSRSLAIRTRAEYEYVNHNREHKRRYPPTHVNNLEPEDIYYEKVKREQEDDEDETCDEREVTPSSDGHQFSPPLHFGEDRKEHREARRRRSGDEEKLLRGSQSVTRFSLDASRPQSIDTTSGHGINLPREVVDPSAMFQEECFPSLVLKDSRISKAIYVSTKNQRLDAEDKFDSAVEALAALKDPSSFIHEKTLKPTGVKIPKIELPEDVRSLSMHADLRAALASARREFNLAEMKYRSSVYRAHKHFRKEEIDLRRIAQDDLSEFIEFKVGEWMSHHVDAWNPSRNDTDSHRVRTDYRNLFDTLVDDVETLFSNSRSNSRSVDQSSREGSHDGSSPSSRARSSLPPSSGKRSSGESDSVIDEDFDGNHSHDEAGFSSDSDIEQKNPKTSSMSEHQMQSQVHPGLVLITRLMTQAED